MVGILRRLAVFVAAAFALYLLAALIGSVIPRNAGWKEPVCGIPVYIASNGVHTDIILPVRRAAVDWHRLTPPTDIRDRANTGGWIGFGWGQREFYLQTETWADANIGVVARAMAGGDALMHVTHMNMPGAAQSLRLIHLDRASYRRLAHGIAASFRRNANGDPMPIPNSGYGDTDTFYAATGTYNMFRTSNQWTADRLAEAGVRVGHWTPFAQGIIGRFNDDIPSRSSPCRAEAA